MTRRHLAIGLALAGLVGLAAFLRCWGWGNWSLWLDEAIQVFLIRRPFREMWTHIVSDGSQPPLDQVIRFGVWRVARSDAALRLPSVVYSCATAILLFVRAGAFRRATPALGAVFSFAILPLAVHYGQEVRPYALGLLLLVAADVARDRSRETGSRRAFSAYLATSVAAVYTVYVAFFPLGIFWIRDLTTAWRHRRENPSRIRRAWIVPAAVIGAFLPWFVTVHGRLRAVNEIPAPPLTWGFVATLLSDFAILFRPVERPVLPVFVFLLAGLGVAAAGRIEGTRRLVDFAGTFILTGAFLVYTNHWFAVRYFYLAVLPFALLLGEALAAPRLLPTVLRLPAAAVLVASVAASMAPALFANAETGRVDWRIPVRYVEGEAAKGRGGPVLPADPFSYFLLSYQSEQGSTPLRVLGNLPNLPDLEGAIRNERNGWVARTPDYGGPADLDAFLKSSRPWARFDRADGMRLYRFEDGRLVSP